MAIVASMQAQPKPGVSWRVADILKSPKTIIMSAAVVVSTFQIFTIGAGGLYVPLSLLLSLVCIAFIALRSEDSTIALLCLLYWLTLLVCVAWSPDKVAWVNGIFYQGLFFISFIAFRAFRDKGFPELVMKLFVLSAIPNALVTIVFRVLPDLKLAYLGSGLLRVFENPNQVLLLKDPTSHINVLDPEKSGGFLFDNGNTGAAFTMLCLGAAVSLMGGRNKLFPVVSAGIFVLAIACSGSKSALLIAVLVAILSGLIYYFRTERAMPALSLALLGAAAVLALLISGVGRHVADSHFGARTVETTSYRVGLLNVAVSLFKDHPIKGLGFGGWKLEMGQYSWHYALDERWPPHNAIVLAWSQAGLASVIILIAIFCMITARLIQRYQLNEGFRPAGAFIGIMCVALMALGDPFPLLGDSHMAFPLGCLIAYGLSSNVTTKNKVRKRRSRKNDPVEAIPQVE